MSADTLPRNASPGPDRLSRRLGVALLLALIVHLLLLTIVLRQEDTPPTRREAISPPIEINIVQSETQEERAPPPESAPPVQSPPEPELTPPPVPELPPTPEPPARPEPQPKPPLPVTPAPAPAPAPKPAPPKPAPSTAPAPARQPPPAPPPPTVAPDLLTNAIHQARLQAAMIETDLNATRPERMLTLTAASRKTPAEDEYLRAWREKVERVGNLNYPEAARRLGLSGDLILDVTLAPDGRVLNIGLRRSSGHPELDEGARRIIELASPFAPFPPEMRARYDRVHIIRTWSFQSGNAFQTR